MKIGVFTALFDSTPLPQTLDILAAMQVEAIEVGTGGYPGSGHCDVDALLEDPSAAIAWMKQVTERGMTVSAFSQHGNPVHPDPERAQHDHAVFEKTVRLAELLEVPVVNGFSGCPGEGPGAQRPNWVTCAWPDDFAEILTWQWDEVLLPYWARQAELCRSHGVVVGIEPHPGFAVYNTETMLKLRSGTGPEIGVNFDPSHLFWQGIDPVESIKALGSAIYHVHAKDTWLDSRNIAVNGVLDTKSYRLLSERSWYFRTVGYGRGEKVWRDIISALRLVGYDGVLSVEHEDPLFGKVEGLTKAVQLLREIRPAESPEPISWA